eukprot:PhM_4_TR18465/c0_g1_i2/m.43552
MISSVTSNIIVSPEVGETDAELEVFWHLGPEIRHVLRDDDEMRLITPDGAVWSRASIWSAERPGNRIRLVAPAKPGSYIFCLYDTLSKRRVFGVPYRVAGSVRPPLNVIKLNKIETEYVPTLGRIDVTIPPDYYAGGSGGNNNNLVGDELMNTDGANTSNNNNSNNSTTCYICVSSPDAPENGGYTANTNDPFDAVVDMQAYLPSAGIVRKIKKVRRKIVVVGEEIVDEQQDVMDESDEGDEQLHLSLISPQEPGKYIIRVMRKMASGILATAAVSNVFAVSVPRSPLTDFDVDGSLVLRAGSTRHVVVGAKIMVEWCVYSGEHLLAPLDHIAFHRYGRSEDVQQPGNVRHVVGFALAAGSCTTRAPTTPGIYDVAYFSFGLQRCLFSCRENIIVEDAYCAIKGVPSAGATVGTASVQDTGCVLITKGDSIDVTWAMERSVFTTQDKLLVFDELGNVFDVFPVSKPRSTRRIKKHKSEFAGLGGGLDDEEDVDHAADAPETVDFQVGKKAAAKLMDERVASLGKTAIPFPCPGKFSVWYHSGLLGRNMARMRTFIVVNDRPPSMEEAKPPFFSTCEISCALEVRTGTPFTVMFEIIGDDSRPATLIGADCLAVFPAEAKDRVPTAVTDNVSAAVPWLDVQYIPPAASEDEPWSGTVTFCGIPMPGEYEIRYMIATRHHWSRHVRCTARFIVVDEVREGMTGAVQNLPLSALTKTKHRFRLRVTDAVLEDSVIHPSGGASMIEAQNDTHNASMVSESVASSATLSMRSSTFGGRSSYSSRSSRAYIPPITSLLHFTQNTEFRGSILPPKIHNTTDAIVVTYHILSGLPRGDDKLVLITEDYSKILSEATLSSSIGREDLTLGSVWLRPPRFSGQYMVGYFSDKHRSIIMLSPVFRVSAPEHDDDDDDDENGGKKNGQCGVKQAAVRRGPTSTRDARTRALLIGISYAQQPWELKGPHNDISLMQDTLVNYLDVSEKDIRVMSDFSSDSTLLPTAVNIRSALAWLVEGLAAKDNVIFYYSGYGSRMGRSENETSFDNILLPMDYDWGPRVISFYELRTLLFDAVPAGVNLSVFLDCCFEATPREVCQQHLRSSHVLRFGERGLQRLRDRKSNVGQDPHAPMRCLCPPKGMFMRPTPCPEPQVPAPFFGALGEICFVPYSTVPTASHSDGNRAGVFVFEAAREPAFLSHDAQGAWDVFLPEAGSTVGYFTHCLSLILQEVSATELPVWMLYERVLGHMRKSPLGRVQTPRLWVADLSTLDRMVMPMQGEED